jgi:uncharacterized protein
MTRVSIQSFLDCRNLAVVGVSRSGKKFSNTIYRELKARKYRVFPVNAQARQIDSDLCYPDLLSLPEMVERVVFVVPPPVVVSLLPQVVERGIPMIWLQQGTESGEAIQYCQDHGIQVISGECLLMFLEPVTFFHRIHRGIRRLIGRLPS